MVEIQKNVIRLTKHEKRNINFDSKFLTLFYLEHTTVKKDKKYTVPTILKFGQRSKDKGEVLPVLSYKRVFEVECVEVKNFVKYDKLSKNIFKYSLKHIQDQKSLQKNILRKYRRSRPYLTNKEIIEQGVGYTILKFIKNKS